MGKRSRSTLNCVHFSPLDAGDSPCRVSDGAGSLSTFLLLHLVSLVGQVALQQVAYLEVSVSAELRRRRMLKEEKTKRKSDTSTRKQRAQVRTKGFFPMGSSSSVSATANFWRNAVLRLHEVQGNVCFRNRNRHILIRIDRESWMALFTKTPMLVLSFWEVEGREWRMMSRLCLSSCFRQTFFHSSPFFLPVQSFATDAVMVKNIHLCPEFWEKAS